MLESMNHIKDLFIRLLADGLIVPVVLIGAWALWRVSPAERRARYSRALMMALTALLIAKTASLLYHGVRPFVAMGTAPKAAYLQNGGFPSDHVLLVSTITLLVWANTRNSKLSMTLLMLSVLVAIGRVLALVHTPIDVTGAMVCALLAAQLWYGRDLWRMDSKVVKEAANG